MRPESYLCSKFVESALSLKPYPVGTGIGSSTSGASVLEVKAPDIRGPTIMNPASPSVITSSPLIPSLTASRTPTAKTTNKTQVGAGMRAKDERDEHDRKADDASARITSHGARHRHPSGVSLSVGVGLSTLRP